MNMCMRFVVLGLALVLLPAGAVPAQEPHGLVLVADVRSGIQTLTLQEVRKAYLGATVEVDGRALEPLVNQADEALYEVFLQKVMFMSAQAYQRQLVRRFLHAQGRRPAVYRDRTELLAVLAGNPYAVTYIMWRDEAERHDNLKVVTVLWDGDS